MKKYALAACITGLTLLAGGCTKDLKTYRLDQKDNYVSRSGGLFFGKGGEDLVLADGRHFRINDTRVLLDPDFSVAGDETVEPLEKGKVYSFQDGYKLEITDIKTPKAKVTKKLGFWGSVGDAVKPW
ncbi:MAG: hypothetical protein HY515_02460 [Candidatus Aenigmarchaeota archaeon]|nr:hypothetical protein [Candidatus Aenigmarchaeota archaeon]